MTSKGLLAGLAAAALAVCAFGVTDASACSRWKRACGSGYGSYYAPPVGYSYGYGAPPGYGYVPPAPVYGFGPPPRAYYASPYAAPVRGYGYRGRGCDRGYGYAPPPPRYYGGYGRPTGYRESEDD